MGQSLGATEPLSQNLALMDSIGASCDAFTWHREFYAHLDAFLSAARSVPEIIKCCFGADEVNREMRAWFDSLNAAERERRRTHAATEFVPSGWIPCAHLYPPHPARDGFGHPQPFRNDCHASFQEILGRFGDAELFDIKRRIFEAVTADRNPSALSPANGRFSRVGLRIALRQIKMTGEPAPAIDAWLAAHDHVDGAEPDEDHPCTA
jgi:hypothetical protein